MSNLPEYIVILFELKPSRCLSTPQINWALFLQFHAPLLRIALKRHSHLSFFLFNDVSLAIIGLRVSLLDRRSTIKYLIYLFVDIFWC